ncbi:MAG: DUF58 domain-containing protein [Candidatus Bipolaricaulaceae bacterium]
MRPDHLLDEGTMRALARRRLTVRRAYSGLPGAHPAPRSGLSLEFADYRPYQPGDDFRLIDWAVYARHRRLVTKLFTHEAEVPLYLLVDTSRSMGEGKASKLAFARRLAAALAYVAFRGQDRFGVYWFSEQVDGGIPARRGRPQLAAVLEALAGLTAAGATDLAAALRSWAQGGHERGLAVVVSDFLQPDGAERGVAALHAARHQVVAVQVLAREDLAPRSAGEVHLVDVERGHGRDLVLAPRTLRAYQQALRAFTDQLASFCLSRQVAYRLSAADGEPVETVLGLLARRR